MFYERALWNKCREWRRASFSKAFGECKLGLHQLDMRYKSTSKISKFVETAADVSVLSAEKKM